MNSIADIDRIASQKNTKRKTASNILSRWQLYLMLAPAVLYILLFCYKPMYGIVIAFKSYSFRDGIMGSSWVGLDNFMRLFRSYWFPIILKNTLSISLLSLVIGFPAPILLALMANEISNQRVKKVFQTASYAPYFISTVVVCGMITMFLSPNIGIINRFLNFLGFESVSFMQDATKFKWIYVLSGVWQGTGWSAIIYFAALSAVDKELLDAAQIDGANRFQRIAHVNFPVLVPTIVILFILSCGSILGIGYEKVYLLQNPANISGSEVISTYVFKMGLEKQDFSFSTAAGVFNSVVNCVILLLVNFISRKVGEISLL